MTILKKILQWFTLVVVGVALALWLLITLTEVPNQPHRVSPHDESNMASEETSCKDAFQEEKEDGYDIGFVEFSERGNVFRRDCMDYVLKRVAERAEGNDAAVIVFVHGWMHNAHEEDTNVYCFKRLLANYARDGKSSFDPGLDYKNCYENQFGDFQGTLVAPKSGLLHGRKVVGVYVGWRGLPFDAFQTQIVSFWDRKAVTGALGPGGVTELLLRLENIVWRSGDDATVPPSAEIETDVEETDEALTALASALSEEPEEPLEPSVAPKYERGLAKQPGNVFLVIGHSFGGAIVLSALHDILLERVISADEADPIDCQNHCSECELEGDEIACALCSNGARQCNDCRECDENGCRWCPTCEELGEPCYRTRPFGHGVVLLNPAIEANAALQLKELVASKRFAWDQTKLLHVISSEGDSATHVAFQAGQRVGVGPTWRHGTLWREQAPGDWISLDEFDLDITTVGNYPGFRTGWLRQSGKS